MKMGLNLGGNWKGFDVIVFLELEVVLGKHEWKWVGIQKLLV